MLMSCRAFGLLPLACCSQIIKDCLNSDTLGGVKKKDMQDLMRFLRVLLVDAVERPEEMDDDVLQPIMTALGNYIHFIQLAKLEEPRASEVSLLHQVAVISGSLTNPSPSRP